MRIIRTEIYFDEEIPNYSPLHAPTRAEEFGTPIPGISFLWIKGDVQDFLDISEIHEFSSLPRYFSEQDDGISKQDDGEIYAREISIILDLFLIDAESLIFSTVDLFKYTFHHPKLVDVLLSSEVVMERSPPFSLSLKTIIDSKNAPLWIGTYLGIEAAKILPAYPILLFLTVPGGIIIVSSAHGIATAMQNGLTKVIGRFFKTR